MDDNTTETPVPAPDTATTTTTTTTDVLPADPETSWLWHVEQWGARAAALVYSDVVAAERQVVKWRHNNPQLAGLFDMAMTYLTNKATAHGVPVGALTPAMIEVEIALKTLAQQDPTFNTGPAKTL